MRDNRDLEVKTTPFRHQRVLLKVKSIPAGGRSWSGWGLTLNNVETFRRRNETSNQSHSWKQSDKWKCGLINSDSTDTWSDRWALTMTRTRSFHSGGKLRCELPTGVSHVYITELRRQLTASVFRVHQFMWNHMRRQRPGLSLFMLWTVWGVKLTSVNILWNSAAE